MLRDGYTVAEVAAALKVHETTVRRTRAKIARLLGKRAPG
jgi:DNA-binding NarL/FixJ family response regulator